MNNHHERKVNFWWSDPDKYKYHKQDLDVYVNKRVNGKIQLN